MNKRCLSGFFYTLFCALLVCPSIFKQEQEKFDPLQHEVSVTLKLIQVYVTDKKGNPAVDLTKEDFFIWDNGKKKQITDFEKHVLTVPVVGIAKAETVREKDAPVDAPKLNRKFYIFFDFAFNTSRGILDSKKAALHFIDEYIQPTDELGLFSFSAGEGLVLHEILTTDHNKVREIIEGFGIRRILGRAENLERKYWRQVMELDELSKQGANPFEMAVKQQEKEVLKTARIEFQFRISALQIIFCFAIIVCRWLRAYFLFQAVQSLGSRALLFEACMACNTPSIPVGHIPAQHLWKGATMSAVAGEAVCKVRGQVNVTVCTGPTSKIRPCHRDIRIILACTIFCLEGIGKFARIRQNHPRSMPCFQGFSLSVYLW